jgi:hypothetical protein
MKLPPKRERARSNIPRAPKREWPRHRAFLRRHQCVVGRVDCDNSRIEVAHIRSAANSGTGIKPADWDAIPLCWSCHKLQHLIGQREFEKQFHINLTELAKEFARQSPDTGMREAMNSADEGR